MTDQNEAQPAHATLHAGHTGVVVSQLLDEDWTPTADPSSNALTEAIDGVLHLTADLARRLIGAHQAAAALVIEGDWTRMRKYFSLSPRYAAWYDYRTPAVGFGIHAVVVKQNVPIRLTQAELERHPPMRGWLCLCLARMGATMVCCSSRISTMIRTLPRRTRRS